MKSIRGRIGQAIAGELGRRDFKLDVEWGFGYRLARYRKDGALDNDTYKAVQELGNKLKIERVYAAEGLIARIADHARKNIPAVSGILCHGTRNGAELRWFADHFADTDVLGTDISDTAAQFPNTIQWDFHDFHEDWRDRWSVIYSNSWDHSHDPHRMFKSWADSLAKDGLLYVEHNSDSLRVNELDLFGATIRALTKFAVRGSEGKLRRIGTIDGRDFGAERTVLVFAKQTS